MERSIIDEPKLNSSPTRGMLSDDPMQSNADYNLSELFTGNSLLELCNSFWMRSPDVKKDVQPYLRGCKWSPDGTCCLSVVNHDGFHIMELPRDLYEGCPTGDRLISLLPAVIHIKESGTVYDFCWYPKMNSHYPDTCSWISTKINSPIQMWDAYDGTLRCSYRGFNAVDEMEPALSVTFINQGQRIIGGYRNCLRTFDVERPGRDFLEHKIKSPASCFGTHGNLLAVGSWNADIKLFSILDNGTYRSVGNLHAHTGGITHLQFTPDGTKLVSGARKDHNLCVWDVRYHRRPLNILKRAVSTNQRIYFDISACGRYLVSGGTDGVVRVWDNKVTKWTEQFNVKDANQENATFRFQLHRDCCNSISIHPSRPILATGSGQFHFLDPAKILELECDSGTNCDDYSSIGTKSKTNASSSDEQTLLENTQVSLKKVHETSFANDVDLTTNDVCKNTCQVRNMESTKKEFNSNIPEQNISEVSPSKIILLENSTESPPAKKTKWSNDMNSCIVEEITVTESTVSTPSVETFSITSNINISHIDNKDSTRTNIINPNNQDSKDFPNTSETPTEEDHLFNKPKLEALDKTTFEVIKDNPLPPNNEYNLKNTFQLDSKSSKHCNTSEAFIKHNIDVQSFTNRGELSNSPSQVLKVETGGQFPPEKTTLDDTARLPSKVFTMHQLTKPSEEKCVVDNALESDDSCNDINENKMKYSSYAENNLTFWWIAKID